MSLTMIRPGTERKPPEKKPAQARPPRGRRPPRGHGPVAVPGQRRAEAAIGADAQRAAAFDAPAAAVGVGSVEVIRVGQNERAGAELPHRVAAGEG